MAESYLKTLSSGVMLSTTIYAPPKTGLSQFVINDVIPCALSDKYVTVYIDLSDPKVPVTAAVLAGLERVLAGSSVFQTSFNFLRNIFQAKISIDQKSKSNDFLRKTEIIDVNYFFENKDVHLSLIDNYFKKILEYKSVLVLVDHAHDLDKEDIGRDFCTYFRSLISQNSSMIRPLYATNNLSKWAGVFDNRRSALYSEGAFVHKLPILGKVFVREAVQRMGLGVSMEEACKCFDLVSGQPGVFIAMVMGWQHSSNVSLAKHFNNEMGEQKIKNKINASQKFSIT